MKTIPYWWGTSAYRESQPLAGARDFDVVILGAGFTGLSTAYHLKKLSPGLSIGILEKDFVGYGASGRNAGFGMTLFGLNMVITKARFGMDKTRQAHRYMENSVDTLWDLIQSQKLECDAERSGFLKLATTPGYEKRIQHELKLAHSLGIKDIEWLDAEAAQARVQAAHVRGAWWEPRCVLLNPAKLAREMKRLAETAGAEIFEKTEVQSVKKTAQGYEVVTPGATVRTKKLVFAANAFSTAFPQLRSKQVPAFTYITLTEPLGDRLASLGWKGREGIEDARNLIHYFRLTKDNRLLMGGGDVKIPFGNNSFDIDDEPEIFAHLERFIPQLFPQLAGVKIEHRWGGPVSVTLDMAPALGYLGKERDAVYSLGCIGHGVSMTQHNGLTLAELLLEKKSERTETFFVNRWTIPWPPEPLRFAVAGAICGYMRIEDHLYERGHFTK